MLSSIIKTHEKQTKHKNGIEFYYEFNGKYDEQLDFCYQVKKFLNIFRYRISRNDTWIEEENYFYKELDNPIGCIIEDASLTQKFISLIDGKFRIEIKTINNNHPLIIELLQLDKNIKIDNMKEI